MLSRDAALNVEARRLESVDVVESCIYSMWKVWRVASAANETRRFANDLRLASRLSRSSRSLAAACCSSSVRRAMRETVGSSLNFWSDLSEVLCTSDWRFCFGGFEISGNVDIRGLRIDRGAASDLYAY